MGAGTIASALYEDDGHSKDFERGLSTIRKFKHSGESNLHRIIQTIEGDYESSFQNFEIVLHALNETPKAISVDGNSMPFSQENNNIKFTVNKSFKEIKIES